MIYVIGGPTGTGKTQLALALAKAWNAPVINADAFQMYQQMDIGTNKDRQRMLPFKPYLFDHISVNDAMTVARYQQAFRALVADLSPLHPRIIVVGGTGLYIKASMYDFHFATHQQIPDVSSFQDWDDTRLYAHLKAMDPLAAMKIHPHNRRRVLRAIAIFLATGQTKSQQEVSPQRTLLYPATFVGMALDRKTLYAQLDARVEQMIKDGLVEEVKQLLVTYGNEPIAFQAIGYKEIIAHLNGKMSLQAAIDQIKLATRRYAKRQMTYFRHQFPMQWFSSWQEAYQVLK